jgi:hypothetical protein
MQDLQVGRQMRFAAPVMAPVVKLSLNSSKDAYDNDSIRETLAVVNVDLLRIISLNSG